jgi:predicted DNA binding CopG/RHH family protein
MRKRFPDLKTDEEAERFVETADLSEYDFSDFKPFSFEFEPKSKSVTMRLPETLLNAVKAKAAQQGIPYQRLIRQTLEREVSVPRAASKTHGR